MLPTKKAILARFSGDAQAALEYCEKIAETYEELHREYSYLAWLLSRETLKVRAAHA